MLYMPLHDEISPKIIGAPAWSGTDLSKNPHSAEDKAERVEAMFTSIARSYDLNNRVHSMWQDQAWRARAVKMATVSSGDDVVDVACGTGDLSMAFYKANVCSVIGIDFTQAMLDVAVTKAEASAMKIDYRQGDAMDLDLPDNSADVVSIAFGIRNVQDPSKAFSEFYRVLRPAGRLIVLEFSTPKNWLVRVCNNLYTNRIMPITATFISRDKSGAYKYLPKSIATFADATTLGEEIQRSGFVGMHQVPQTFGVCTITVATKN
jgi:demethylmenaquinone methyltransferase/2-methoxy-6-polyprenyl-1,4-benzoquinol methylase